MSEAVPESHGHNLNIVIDLSVHSSAEPALVQVL